MRASCHAAHRRSRRCRRTGCRQETGRVSSGACRQAPSRLCLPQIGPAVVLGNVGPAGEFTLEETDGCGEGPIMRMAQHTLEVATSGQGLYEITAQVTEWVA